MFNKAEDSDLYMQQLQELAAQLPSSSAVELAAPKVGVSAEAASEKDFLVERVKALQRRGPDGKQAWYNWCKRRGSADFDPRRHDVSFLGGFFQDLSANSGMVPPASAMGLGAAATAPGGAGGVDAEGPQAKETLMQWVKENQRTSPQIKQHWYAWCAMQGTSDLDPLRHSASSLRQFYEAVMQGKFSSKGRGRGDNLIGKAAQLMEMAGIGVGPEDPSADDDWGAAVGFGAFGGGLSAASSSASSGLGPIIGAPGGSTFSKAPSLVPPAAAMRMVPPAGAAPLGASPADAGKGKNVMMMKQMVAEMMAKKAREDAVLRPPAGGKSAGALWARSPSTSTPPQWFAATGTGKGKSEFGVLDMEKPQALLAAKRGAVSMPVAPEGNAGLMTEEQAKEFQRSLKRKR